MEMSENSALGSNPLYKHKLAATSTEAPLATESPKPAPQTSGTGANRSLPTDGPVSQGTNEATDLSANGDAPAEADPADDESPDDHVEEGDEDDIFDDDLEVDGDNVDLNSDIEDDDLDTLDGPLLDENNPRH
jgi:hypothetical protein